MSGGSYDYLYIKEPEDLFYNPHIDNMVDRLIELDAPDAATELEQVNLILQNARVRVNARMERLKGILKAVEWYDSCDSGLDAVEGALERYRNGEEGAAP